MLPSFATERLLLRPRTMSDLAACLAMDRDPEVTRYVAGPWNEPRAHEAFVRDRIQRPYPAGLGYWSIFPRNTPEQFLGWILLIPVDAVGPEVEIGWRLVHSTWAHGYATEAARPVAHHAFEVVGLDRIVAAIDRRNTGSLRVAEKLGMTPGDFEHDADGDLQSLVLTAERYRALNAMRRDEPRA